MTPDAGEPQDGAGAGAGRTSPAEAAADWTLRLTASPDDPAARAAFDHWLAADPANAAAWQRVSAAWRLLGEVPPGTTARWPAPPRPAPAAAAPAAPRRMPSRRRVAAVAAALAVAAGLALVLAPSLALRWRADHANTTTGVRHVVLEDGSAVDLAPGAALDARFTADGRAVVLLEGEAFFDVVRDADRPFTVTAGGLTVTVLGTAFGVRRADTALAVEVQRGAVAVRYDGGGSDGVDARLGPGDRVAVDLGTGAVAQGRMAPGEVAAWREGRLFVADATVADVVARLRRVHPGWIVVVDDALARHRVTGLYDLRDPDRALRALVQPAGGRVTTVTPLLHVLTLP